MSKIKKYTKKLRKKLNKKNIDVKETDVMELKKLRNKAKELTDSRIKKKCTYKLWDIVCAVLIATLCNCDDWEEIYIFANENKKCLRSFLQLTGGIPTSEKKAAYNLQIMKKNLLSILNMVKEEYKLSMKKIRFKACLNPEIEVPKMLYIAKKKGWNLDNIKA